MIFKEKFPSIKTLAQPQITKSPFNSGLAIAYPYTKYGDWLHKEELMKYCLDKQKVKEIIDNFEFGAWDQMDRYEDWVKRELKKSLGLK